MLLVNVMAGNSPFKKGEGKAFNIAEETTLLGLVFSINKAEPKGPLLDKIDIGKTQKIGRTTEN